MRSFRPLVLLCVAIAALVAGIAATTAATSTIGTSGDIAWQVGNSASNLSIYAGAIGSTPTRISAPGNVEGQPAWSPDGTRIAFHRIVNGNVDVYTMNADGTNVRRVTTNAAEDASPSWSPDGTKLAFDSNRDGNSEIYVINTDGTNEHRLTNNPADDSFPAWSPDGTRIAFQSNRTGNYEIFTMSPDGSDQFDLSNEPGADDFVPNWSGSGKSIAYTHVLGDQSDVYTMLLDGTHQFRVTKTGVDSDPAWSADGSRIVYAHNTSPTNPDVWVVDAGGRNGQAVAATSQPEDFPDWQPPICTVAKVVDGDTFVCKDGTRVDMLAIDAPDINACGGDWAAAALQNIFLPVGKKVALAFDEITSAPGVVLAAPIVLGDDGADYNISIVMAYVGLAKAAQVGGPYNTKYTDWANASQKWAQTAGWNMWAPGKPFNGGC